MADKSKLEDLYVDLHNEMGLCDDCPSYYNHGPYACVDCATNVNIEFIKGKISSLIRGEEHEQIR